MKHIESILPEHAADELTRMLAGDDATATAALTTLLHNATGCDIPETSDLPASEVEELVPLCVSILRRHWKTPLTCLGDGSTPMSLAELMRQLIDGRVNGNEALGIPAANANLPTAVAALRQRKISNGAWSQLADGTPSDGIQDGTSLVRLLCSAASDSVTELRDDNEWWGVLRYVNILSLFPNIKRLQISCTEINQRMYDMPTIESLSMPYLERTTDYKGIFYNSFVDGTELDFPSLDYVSFGSNFTPCIQNCNMRVFKADKLRIVRSNGTNSPCFYDCKYLEEILMPSLEYCNHYGITTQGGGLANKCPNLWKVVVGDLSDTSITTYGGSCANGMGFVDCPNLIHLELGANGKPVQASVDARWWNPTSVLSDSERLPIFLSNFKTYIAERLTDNGSGLTLTLSQAVRDAIQGDPEIVSIITSKGWTISPAPTA